MFFKSLSARLLVLTIFFVMLCEVLIFVPSVARYRMTYLDNHIASAHLATLALVASPTGTIDQTLTTELLRQVGARAIFLRRANGMVRMLDTPTPPTPDVTFDLSKGNVPRWIMGSWNTLLSSGNRIMRVIGNSPFEPSTTIVVLLPEEPLRAEMWDFGVRILRLSIIISLTTAALVYLSLQWMLVRPMRRITDSMTAFRQDPEDASRSIAATRRTDEIGRAQSELAMLQETVRQALAQRGRLAALGTAVTKINHDLRSILATARLVSDGLADSAAPEVRRVAPRLLDAIDRAVALCTRTLDFSREGAPPFSPSDFPLSPLIAEIPQALGLDTAEVEVDLSVPKGLRVRADRDQLYRVFLNLVRNAVEAGARRLTFSASRERGTVAVEVADNGPGLPPRAQENLFRPFFGSARPGGSGLGLAIARELMRAQGGEIALVETTGAGTVFRLTLPAAAKEPALSRSSK
ncbi:MAG TPA: HAMP domain-containing sensor histidine kinase [Stellaceae bacterium]|jgi:signal transduction histidine kinase|nr:HAMP domain-containing sensor histidine kinase [Stellaceae bacterium]